MSNFLQHACRVRSCIIILMLAVALIASPPGIATELELTLESGSVLQADVSISAINWTEVQSNGEMTERRVATSDIKRLWLSKTPASNQVAEILSLLVSLNSDRYRVREEAERQLSEPEIGGRYPKMLRQFAIGTDAETRYRVDRILEKISDAEASSPSEFDELELKSGRILRGDAGDFQFQCNVDGNKLTFRRNQLLMIRSPNLDLEMKLDPAKVAEPVDTQIALVSAEKFYLPEQTTIQLEADPLGNELGRKADISKTFIPLGLKLGSEEPGYVGISGYGFKFPDTPTGKNSGTVFQEFRNGDQIRYKKFRGTLIVDFCAPNQPHVRAGVNEFGVHIANVEHERDFIMEAFNAAGQVIATVESGERDCPFLGIQSNQLIAEVRIRSNPFLDKLHRKIDDDFAFDSICFSTPKRLLMGSFSVEEPNDRKASVRLKNGNVWVANDIEVEADGSIKISDDQFKTQSVFTPDVIDSYTFANRDIRRRPTRRSWSMQITDGSILNVDPRKVFRSQLVSDYLIPVDQAVALWPSESLARFAHTADWDSGMKIVVIPTGRILTDGIEFSDDGYSWQTLDKRLQDLAPNASEAALNEDPMPDLEQVIYKEVDLDSGPTLWLQQPRTLDPKAGYVMLRDGQRLMFGEGHLFQLIERGTDSVKLKLNDRTIEIENNRIQAVQLENTP